MASQALPGTQLLNSSSNPALRQWEAVPPCPLEAAWMWYLGTWVGGGISSAGGAVGLGGLGGLFQPTGFGGSEISGLVPGLFPVSIPEAVLEGARGP